MSLRTRCPASAGDVPSRSGLIFFAMFIFFAVAMAFAAELANAEPWISNRFAQNCAGCHAPGRKNLAPAARRCTLACQGCHVSPNGSGLRSHYGKWNEDRWLRSFRTDVLAHEKAFAPIKQQRYGLGKKWKKAKKKAPHIIKKGFPLVEIPGTEMDEAQYDRADGLEKVVSESRDEFEFQVSQGDPYRQMYDSKIDGGVDLRWQVQSTNVKSADSAGNESDRDRWFNFLMVGDVGLRWRPIHKKIHVVYEGRHLGQPDDDEGPDDTLGRYSLRSLYAMVDDLPYNLYTMAGYYRPLFGNFNPDHTILPQRMLSYAQQGTPAGYDLTYKSASFGGSPNVPYANIHLIGPQLGSSKNASNKGFAANLGGRFVKLGFSVAYSYWRTEKDVQVTVEEVTERLEMHSVGIGAQLGPVTANLDAYSFTKDTPNDAFREGGVYGLETYTRIWRENYLQIAFYTANVAEDLNPGSGRQMRVGLRSFLFPGVDVYFGLRLLETQVLNDADGNEISETNTGGFMSQLHLYL